MSWLSQGIAGQVFAFTIFPVDRFGNSRDDADDSLLFMEAFQFAAVATLVLNVGGGKGTPTVTASIAYNATLKA